MMGDCKVVVGESVARQNLMVVCTMKLEVEIQKRVKVVSKMKW